MTSLDASIPLQLRQIQLENPQDIRAKALSIGAMQRQADQDVRAQKEQQTIRDLYRQNTDSSGRVNSAGLYRGVAGAGLGDILPGMQKADAELQKGAQQTNELELKNHKTKLDYLDAQLAGLAADPNLTTDKVIQTLSNADPTMIPPELAAQTARELPHDPVRLRQYIVQHAMQVADAKTRIDLLLPKYDEQNRGGTINEGTINQLTGVREEGPDVQKTPDPSFMAQLGKAPANYRFKSDGNLEFIPGGAADPAVASSNRNLRPIPAAAASGIIANRSSLAKIDAAIAAVKANPDAFGLSNYMGDAIKQRTDPGGVDPRAKVADIGSLQIHDRSGAAVTASETPRLQPFVPTATDNAQTIITKLENLKANYASQNEESESFYSPESGYRPIGGGQSGPTAAPTNARPPLDAFRTK